MALHPYWLRHINVEIVSVMRGMEQLKLEQIARLGLIVQHEFNLTAPQTKPGVCC